MREETLQLVSAIANHKSCQSIHHLQLREMLVRQLKNWPHDRKAWIGDQCDGLIAYELIRDGFLLSVLSKTEINKLKKGAGLKVWIAKISRSIDSDQWFYLSSMSTIIKSCEQPLYQRRKTLQKIAKEIKGRVGSDQYPYVAATVLLDDLMAGHVQQAADRARCEAWLIVLSKVTNRVLKTAPLNPLDGKPYTVVQQGDQLQVEISEGEVVSVKTSLPSNTAVDGLGRRSSC